VEKGGAPGDLFKYLFLLGMTAGTHFVCAYRGQFILLMAVSRVPPRPITTLVLIFNFTRIG
jgi:hypothetical protein